MCRYVVLLLSVLMLLVTFNSPTSDWLIDLDVLGCRVYGNIFYWLFMTCVVIYIPLMIGGAILFFYDFVLLLKTKQRHHAINLVFFSTITFVALYRFNGWVFGGIF